jgi:hypothetical protein
MKIETNGWGDSMVATKYIYERVHGILDGRVTDMPHELSRFMDELAHNYRVDTGNLIGENDD